MSQDVSTSVRSIIASFINGFDVTTSLRERTRRRKRSKTEAQQAERATSALTRSLQQSPWMIEQEYEKGLRSVGPRFAHGDGVAITRLNEILLRLNTGLVSIITSFLHLNSSREPQLDLQSLTALSEASCRESLGVLQQLYQRIRSRQPPARVPARSKGDAIHSRDRNASRHPRQLHASTKTRKPQIAQVTIEDSSKRPQLAVVKPSTIAKKRSASTSDTHLPRTPSASSSTTLVNTSSQLSLHRGRDTAAHSSEKLTTKSTSGQRQATTLAKHARKSQHNLTVSPSAKSMPNLLPPYSAHDTRSRPQPPLPPVKPRHLVAPRKSTPTMYSINSDSTKLGEIPMHKWAVPYDFDASSMMNKEAMQNGWPLRDINGQLLVTPKKRFGWFGLRKRAAAV